MQNNFHKNFRLNNISFTSVDEILTYVKTFSSEMHQFLEEWFSNTNFIIVNTSGSTGATKLIKLKKELMINSALATGSFFSLKEKTTVLLCLPIKYIAGKMMLIRAITLGWHLDVKASDSYPLKEVYKNYDFSAMVPLQVDNSILELSKIKKLIIGGGVVSKSLQKKLQTVSSEVFVTYGMTETITHIAAKKLNTSSLNTGLYVKGIFFYEVLPNITIYKDQRDCLVISAPKISEEIIFSNDVVNLISDTKFEWLGRFDNVINSGGIKLHPEKIEEKLFKIINNRFFIAGVLDEKLGEKMILVIESQSDKILKNQNLFLNKIKNLKTLSKFEVPKEIYFVDTFLETETKKIQRKKTLDLIF